MENLKEIFTISMYVCGIVFFVTLAASFIQSFVRGVKKEEQRKKTLKLLQMLSEITPTEELEKEKD